MIDRCGRNIDYMRISVTDRCNLRCIYCMPASGVQSFCHSDVLSYEEIVRVVRQAAMASGLSLGFGIGIGGLGVGLVGIVIQYVGLEFAINMLICLPFAAAVLALTLQSRGIAAETA